MVAFAVHTMAFITQNASAKWLALNGWTKTAAQERLE